MGGPTLSSPHDPIFPSAVGDFGRVSARADVFGDEMAGIAQGAYRHQRAGGWDAGGAAPTFVARSLVRRDRLQIANGYCPSVRG